MQVHIQLQEQLSSFYLENLPLSHLWFNIWIGAIFLTIKYSLLIYKDFSH